MSASPGGGPPLAAIGVKVQVAFASKPLDNPQVWTDLTAMVQKITINRGRQHVLDHFEPGRCTIDFDARSQARALDPLNTSSTYYPNVDVNKQVQVLASWNLLSANAASIETDASAWGVSLNCTVAQSSAQSLDGTHSLAMTASGAGTMEAITATGTSGIPVVPLVTYSVMGWFRANTTGRTCQVQIVWYTAAGTVIGRSTGVTATDSSSGWTQSVSSSQAPSNAAFAAVVAQVASAGAGEVHYLDQVGLFPDSGVTAWASGGPVPLFTGFVDSWLPKWPNNSDETVQMTATDGLRLLNQKLFTSLSYETSVVADGPTQFWPLQDLTGSVAANDITGVPTFTGTYVGNCLLGQGGPSVAGLSYGVKFDGIGAYMNSNLGQVNGLPSCGGAWEFCFKQTSGQVGTQTLCNLETVSGAQTQQVHVDMDASGHLILAFVTTTPSSGSSATTGTYNDGNWHHVVVNSTNPGSNPVFTVYVDGVLVMTYTATSFGGGRSGTVVLGCAQAYDQYQSFSQFFSGWMAYASFYNAPLTTTQISNHYSRLTGGFIVETSPSRIQSVLSLIGWPSAWEDIPADAGASQIIVPTASLTTTSVLAYLQQVETAENGALYVKANGYLAFRSRHAQLQSPGSVSQSTFGDAPSVGSEINYLPLPEFTLDDVDLYNMVASQRSGGVVQTAQDTTSQSKYGVANVLTETGLLITTDAEALSRAQWEVAHFAYPIARVASLAVEPLDDLSTRWPAILNRELHDRVTVIRRTNLGGSVFQQDSLIEGIDHEIDSAGTWRTTYHLSPAETQSYWILGDATNGVLGSTTRLCY